MLKSSLPFYKAPVRHITGRMRYTSYLSAKRRDRMERKGPWCKLHSS